MSEKSSENLIISFYENEVENFILEQECKNELDSKIELLKNFISNNKGENITNKEADSLYVESQAAWGDVRDYLKELKFNLFLNRNQYKYLYGLLTSKMEYDIETVFYAVELRGMLDNMGNIDKSKNDTDLSVLKLNATEITYTYHLISSNKVKGLTKEAYTFVEILTRISGILGIANHYNEVLKSLSNDIQTWVASFIINEVNVVEADATDVADVAEADEVVK